MIVATQLAVTLGHRIIDKPLRIVAVVVLATFVHLFVRNAIKRFVAKVRSASTTRAAQRAATLTLVLRSIGTAAIWTTAVLLVLGEVGVNLGPLLAGAGIVGIAIGFGAQSLVKDVLAGMFMLIEDQYGVGDEVDLGVAQGVVEAVTLRTTRLRDSSGAVWHVPNGEVHRVGNFSQLPAGQRPPAK